MSAVVGALFTSLGGNDLTALPPGIFDPLSTLMRLYVLVFFYSLRKIISHDQEMKSKEVFFFNPQLSLAQVLSLSTEQENDSSRSGLPCLVLLAFLLLAGA